jgi:hypothetical protein
MLQFRKHRYGPLSSTTGAQTEKTRDREVGRRCEIAELIDVVMAGLVPAIHVVKLKQWEKV